MKFGACILYVPDVPAALEFYERAFGLERKFLHESNSYGELATGATRLAFAAEALAAEHAGKFDASRPGQPPQAAEVVFVTDNVEAAFRVALDAGAEELKRPEQKPWGQVVAYVRDLNGFLVELCTAWD
jgi:catechol 2,3-dioxygenase-like lactoylglutathione lyase family enzyme